MTETTSPRRRSRPSPRPATDAPEQLSREEEVLGAYDATLDGLPPPQRFRLAGLIERMEMYVAATREGLTDVAIAQRFDVDRRTIQRLRAWMGAVLAERMRELRPETAAAEHLDELDATARQLASIAALALVAGDLTAATRAHLARAKVLEDRIQFMARLGFLSGAELGDPDANDQREREKVARKTANDMNASIMGAMYF